MSLLSVADLKVSFGGVAAVDGVSFDVEAGTLLGLIGPNGAGKTTTVEAVTGFAPLASGTITFDGHAIERWPPHRRARAGLVRSFQSVELFDDLSVRENLLAAAHRRTWRQSLLDTLWPRRHGDPDSVDEALEATGIADLAPMSPAELSQGQRKLCGLARALACRPSLLLLDEPAAGLDSSESLALGDRLRAVVEQGIAIVLVDHDMGLVLGVSDHVVVLDNGRLLAEGAPATIRSDQRVIDAYLGDDALGSHP